MAGDDIIDAEWEEVPGSGGQPHSYGNNPSAARAGSTNDRPAFGAEASLRPARRGVATKILVALIVFLALIIAVALIAPADESDSGHETTQQARNAEGLRTYYDYHTHEDYPNWPAPVPSEGKVYLVGSDRGESSEYEVESWGYDDVIRATDNEHDPRYSVRLLTINILDSRLLKNNTWLNMGIAVNCDAGTFTILETRMIDKQGMIKFLKTEEKKDLEFKPIPAWERGLKTFSCNNKRNFSSMPDSELTKYAAEK